MRLGEFWKNNFKIIRLDWCGGSDGEGAKADDDVESVHEGEGFEECEGVVEGEGVDDVKGVDKGEGFEECEGVGEGEGVDEVKGVDKGEGGGEGFNDVKGIDDVECVEASFCVFSVFFKQTFFSKLM